MLVYIRSIKSAHSPTRMCVRIYICIFLSTLRIYLTITQHWYISNRNRTLNVHKQKCTSNLCISTHIESPLSQVERVYEWRMNIRASNRSISITITVKRIFSTIHKHKYVYIEWENVCITLKRRQTDVQQLVRSILVKIYTV